MLVNLPRAQFPVARIPSRPDYPEGMRFLPEMFPKRTILKSKFKEARWRAYLRSRSPHTMSRSQDGKEENINTTDTKIHLLCSIRSFMKLNT
jgi:hypothetical protein